MPPAEGLFFLMLLFPRSVFSTPSPQQGASAIQKASAASGAMRHPPCLKQKNPLPLKSDRGQRVEPLMAR